jgi:chromosome segregation ATPase
MEFNIQIILYLLVLTLVGFLVGLFWARRRVAKQRTRDRERLENKVRGYERELEKTRGELRVQRDETNMIKSELASTKGKLKAREAELSALQAKFKAFESLETELAAKKSELNSAKVEMDSLRSRLMHAEAKLKKPPEPDPRLVAELQTVKQSLSDKENEIATLLGRVKELAPLSIQIKDRDLRLRESETKHAQEIKAQVEEIGKLQSRIRDLETENMRTHSKTASIETKLRELESDQHAALARKNDELAGAQARIAELESQLQSMGGDRAESGERLIELNAHMQPVAVEKDAEMDLIR